MNSGQQGYVDGETPTLANGEKNPDMVAWFKYREMVEAPWCEIRYEDTVADAEKQVRRALDALSLP